MSAAVHSEPPARGTLMQDSRNGKRGQFVGIMLGLFYFRPIGGGREWSAKPEFCVEVEPTEQEASRLRLSAELHQRNLHSLARRG